MKMGGNTSDRPWIGNYLGTIFLLTEIQISKIFKEVINMTVYSLNGYTKDIDQSISGAFRIAILNLMPTKETTENQYRRVLAALETDVELTFFYPASHHLKSDQAATIKECYATWQEIADQHFDGLIITGAPVETVDFEEVDYWDEFCQIIDWSRDHCTKVLCLCWAAQAGMYYEADLPKYPTDQKLFGLYPVTVFHESELFDGIDVDRLKIPFSRHTTNRIMNIERTNLVLIAANEVVGPQIVESADHHFTYITGHPEYDRLTLYQEYHRDSEAGKSIELPANYFKGTPEPENVQDSWHQDALKLYKNVFKGCFAIV